MHHGRIQSPSAAELAQLAPDGRPNYNRLIFESSPYLLQHATNPVDWYPWGEAAFARAREEQKPIFLSIGYATCHWCHVMEHESFENPEAAARLNEVFVCVKVDKEERPDIDNIYMQAVLATSGHGGWPMTVLLTHEATPFFAGTYLPLRSRGGRMGLLELIHRVSDVWRTKRAELEADAAQIAEHVRRQTRREPGTELDEAVLETGYTQLAQRFDRVEGGFGRAPKFPTPHHLLFLLRYHRHHPQSQALSMVTQTLVQMRRGGIFDQVGFGFHRYSTDGVWLLPHFEKMLYDQALLVMAYTEAYQVTRDPQFARTVHEVCTYVLRDLRDADGGFFSAEDADSEGVEGKFYVWSQGELVTLLGPEDAALYAQVYHFEPGGNFSEEATGHRTGDNIPHLRESYEDLAKRLGFAVTALTDRLEQARARLFSFRETRVRPLKDDKVLTDWNGLMIAALAKAGRALACPAYHEAACQAASFIAEHLRDARGFLMKRYRNGQSGLPAHLDDYAFFVWGLIELHQSDYQDRWLDLAVQLTDQTLARFRDSETGAFRFSAHDGETLMVHTVESYDGALPSGNSVLVSNLLRLGRLTGQTHYEEVAQAILDAFSRRLAGSPANSTFMLCGLDLSLDAGADVVVVGRPGAADTEEMLAALQQTFLPSVCVHFKSSESATAGLDRWAPYTQSMETLAGSSTAYVCRDFHCSSPTASCSEMLHQLQGEGCED